MRTLKIFPLILVVFSLIQFSCQDKCYYYDIVEEHIPVLEDLTTITSSYSVREDFPIEKPGNIYTYGELLLVGEKFKGIHILNNSNPSSPQPLKFIDLKGNGNFSIQNNILFAENGPDLLSIDISDIQNIQLLNREKDVNLSQKRGDKFIVGYDVKYVKTKVNCEDDFGGRGGWGARNDAVLSSASAALSTGKGGSMSRMTIIGNYLYIVTGDELIAVNINNPAKPTKGLNIGLNVGQNNEVVETLFPYNSYLYMGTSSGILVYDTKGSEPHPRFVSNIRHIFGCDPVVVDDDIAYSTIRNGTSCRTVGLNQLNIYDVKVPELATRLFSENVIEPYGLGVKENLVFVCQGQNGLFVYNFDKNTNRLSFRHSYPEIHAYDVIANGNTLIVTADNGLFQFDITDPDNIKHLSKLVDF